MSEELPGKIDAAVKKNDSIFGLRARRLFGSLIIKPIGLHLAALRMAELTCLGILRQMNGKAKI